jgi:hypothetical protein
MEESNAADQAGRFPADLRSRCQSIREAERRAVRCHRDEASETDVAGLGALVNSAIPQSKRVGNDRSADVEDWPDIDVISGKNPAKVNHGVKV